MVNDLINRLLLDKGLADKLKRIDEERINKLTERCKANGFASLSGHNDIEKLAVALNYAEKYTKPYYIENNIPLEIYYDTMQDIEIWCANNDNKGLKNIKWLSNHLKGELFKIGRLQYQLYTCNNRTLNYDFLPFNYGDKLIYIHIPQGEKLIFENCISSIKQAKEFFESHFPSFEYRFFFCESWLLYGENYAFMQTSSNILQFQSLFNIVYSVPHDKQAIERIFGKRKILLSSYPTNTSLQKSAVNYMKAKNKLGIGIGIIDKEDI